MTDSFGRNIDYIRISVTDRCNLRCVYCMPKDGVSFLPHSEILSYEEIIRLVAIFARCGISKIKLTGGEPLLRKNLVFLVRELKTISGIRSVTLTTNALLLKDNLRALVDAGLDAVNISIDALSADAYGALAGTNESERAKEALHTALSYPHLTVKLNCVPVAGMNEQELAPLARLARDNPLSVRFIELMPIGRGKNLRSMTEDTVRELIKAETGELVPSAMRGNGPCRYFRAQGFRGEIGFISAMSHRFCGECNRVRLTAEGFLKTCLQYQTGVNLKCLLRSGADDDCLLDAIQNAIVQKPAGHQFATESGTDFRLMHKIGG